MKTVTIIGIVGLLLAATVINDGSDAKKDAKKDARIEEIKRNHKNNTDTMRVGIICGYTVCKAGVPLPDYMADCEARWAKLLADSIKEEEAKRE